MRPGKRRELNRENAVVALINKVEAIKAGIQGKMEHQFWVIKRLYVYV